MIFQELWVLSGTPTLIFLMAQKQSGTRTLIVINICQVCYYQDQSVNCTNQAGALGKNKACMSAVQERASPPHLALQAGKGAAGEAVVPFSLFFSKILHFHGLEGEFRRMHFTFSFCFSAFLLFLTPLITKADHSDR